MSSAPVVKSTLCYFESRPAEGEEPTPKFAEQVVDVASTYFDSTIFGTLKDLDFGDISHVHVTEVLQGECSPTRSPAVMAYVFDSNTGRLFTVQKILRPCHPLTGRTSPIRFIV